MVMVLQQTRLNMSDPNFKFGEILNLNFNQSARQLRNIIDQARKEKLIETELENLELFWTRAQLKFEELRVSPTVYRTLHLYRKPFPYIYTGSLSPSTSILST